jgi:hypothetical protein
VAASLRNPDEEYTLDIFCDDWVTAIYDGKWYIGTVVETDVTDVQISFTQRARKVGNAYKWPAKCDEIWESRDDVISKIASPPVDTGKTRRIFSAAAYVPNHS